MPMKSGTRASPPRPTGSRGPSFWETYFDADRFPTMASVWADGGFDDPAGWDFEQMITRVLDGIEQLALNTRANVNSADLSSGGPA